MCGGNQLTIDSGSMNAPGLEFTCVPAHGKDWFVRCIAFIWIFYWCVHLLANHSLRFSVTWTIHKTSNFASLLNRTQKLNSYSSSSEFGTGIGNSAAMNTSRFCTFRRHRQHIKRKSVKWVQCCLSANIDCIRQTGFTNSKQTCSVRLIFFHNLCFRFQSTSLDTLSSIRFQSELLMPLISFARHTGLANFSNFIANLCKVV